jgi:hypothetical protein
MNILIGRQVDFTAQAVYPLPGVHMFVITILIAHMGIDKKHTGQGQGKSKDTEY